MHGHMNVKLVGICGEGVHKQNCACFQIYPDLCRSFRNEHLVQLRDVHPLQAVNRHT